MQSISHLKIEDFVTREEQGQGQMRGDPLYTTENYLFVGDCIVYLRYLFVCVYVCTNICVVFFFVLYTLCCQFLWIVLS